MDAAFFYAPPAFKSTALSNNTRQCAQVLQEVGFAAASVPLTDLRPSPDATADWYWWLREHRPRLVVLGAFIVPLPDLEQLAMEHPQVTFVQRIHSNLAWLFMCPEDMRCTTDVIELARRRANVRVAFVCPEETRRWRKAGCEDVLCVPNVFAAPIADEPRMRRCDPEWLHLSAFFAIRGLKHPGGHVHAASIVNSTICPTKLHVQLERSDAPVEFASNLRSLANVCGLQMPVEPYREHQPFTDWLRDHIDVGLQLSMTESFNYATMEHLACGVPVVTSHAIPFSPWRCRYEDARAAAGRVRTILDDYPAASAWALDTARTVAERHKSMFLEACQSLLGE